MNPIKQLLLIPVKTLTIAILGMFFLTNLCGQESSQNFVTSDIDNFWTAYDKITATKDSAQQYEYLNKLFIEKGTPGLKAIMKARDYTPQSYIDAINNYPAFWNSVRGNTLKAKSIAGQIETEVAKLKVVYPELKPAKIYFTIGALRTGGTTLEDMILIGSEIALADKKTVTSEFPETYSNLKNFFVGDPLDNIVFTNIHEYVHTQQKTTVGDNLLAQSVLEGVAEFVAVKVTGKPSTAPAISYGPAHNEKIRARFSSQMFNPFTGFWLYSNAVNEFKVRDLGYYVGYAICERYFEKAKDKKQAFKDMIELNYNNETGLRKFVEKSGYFSKSLTNLKAQFENTRPQVIAIKQFKNGDANVSPHLTQITLEFSAKMDKEFRNFELGPLGKSNLPLIKKVIGFSEDRKSLTFETELKPNQHYQITVGDGFRTEEPLSLKPYLIDFKTSE